MHYLLIKIWNIQGGSQHVCDLECLEEVVYQSEFVAVQNACMSVKFTPWNHHISICQEQPWVHHNYGGHFISLWVNILADTCIPKLCTGCPTFQGSGKGENVHEVTEKLYNVQIEKIDILNKLQVTLKAIHVFME